MPFFQMNEIDLWAFWVTGGFGIAASFWAIGMAYRVARKAMELSGDD
jgi:hypothetical protein